MSESIDIVVNVVDKASNSLKNIAAENKALSVALGVVTTAAVAVTAAVVKSIDAYVKYANEVRKLSQLNGTTAEETSRLIQVMDDHKVSVEALNMATRKLAQQGMSLTIDSLAKMSDEYNKLGSNADKSKFLLDKFGRSGFQMVEIMKAGGEAIRNESAAVAAGLVLTEKSLRAARELERAEDQLADTKQALAVTVGVKVVPAYTEFLARLNNVISATNKEELAMAAMINTIRQAPIDTATRGYIAMAESIEMGKTAAEEAAEKFDELKKTTEAVASGGDLNKIAFDMAGVAYANGDISFQQWNDFGVALGQLTPNAASIAQSIQTITQAALNGQGPVGKFAAIIAYLNSLAGSYSYNYSVSTSGGGYNPYNSNVGQNQSTRTYATSKGVMNAAKEEKLGYASGGSASGLFWTGDSPSGLTPHSELVYAPQGAYVFNASQSRSIGNGKSPRAFMGGSMPAASGEMNLSSSTIRQLASAIAAEVTRANG